MQGKMPNPAVVTALMYDQESSLDFVHKNALNFCAQHPRETVVILFRGLVVSASGAHGAENILDAFQFLPQTTRRSC